MSVNASNDDYKADYKSFSSPKQHVPRSFKWSSAGDPDSWPEMGSYESVNASDSIERAI